MRQTYHREAIKVSKFFCFLPVTIAASVALIIFFPGLCFGAQRWNISIKNLRLNKSEKIVSFKLALRGAWIYSIKSTPKEWGLTVANHTKEAGRCDSSVFGNTIVGAGALDASYFRDFVLVKSQEFNSKRKPFTVALTLGVSNNGGMSTRNVVVHSAQIIRKVIDE
ncbi:MAG: hypothetical protein WCT03_22280 [Candidatus Obscuribacterales bacterium]